MWEKMTTGLLAILLASAALAAPELSARDAQQILAASDTIRNPGFSFRVTATLTEYRRGKQTDGSTLDIYSKADHDSGQFRSLIRFAAPARDANKLMLKNGNDLWFHDPSNNATLRISAQQRLLGQAANGDVVTANLALDYRARLAGEEDIQDGDRQPCKCQKLVLEAAASDVTYHRIEMWIDRANNRPVKSRFYAEGGHLLKTAYYRRYQLRLGQERPTETVIIDGLDTSWVTVMRFSDHARQEVPESWLQRDYLSRFRPE